MGPRSCQWHYLLQYVNEDCHHVAWQHMLASVVAYFAVQSQKAITAHFSSKQLLPFAFL